MFHIVLTFVLVILTVYEIYISRKQRKEEKLQHEEMILTLEKFIVTHDEQRDNVKNYRMVGDILCDDIHKYDDIHLIDVSNQKTVKSA